MRIKPVFKTKTARELDHVLTGVRVRMERSARGISLRALARRAGLSASYLSDLERGRRNWTLERLSQIKTLIDRHEKT